MARTLSRRRLAKESLAALGALSVPMIIPASARGADGFVAPSERINMGLIGLGKLGRNNHLKGFLGEDRAHVVAVCDCESIRLGQSRDMADEAYAKRFGKGGYKGCVTYGDFRDLLTRDDIDAVCIATPDHWHAVLAIAAMKSGRDVYCEKPMTQTIGEAVDVAETARRTGRVFQVGSQQRSDRAFRYACELVRNGRIGDVHTVHVGVGGPPKEDHLPEEPLPDSLDWNMWLGPAPYRPYNSTFCPFNFTGFPRWRDYRPYGGGGMTDFGAHHYDIAQWGLGMDDSGPVEVVYPDGEERTKIMYRYANGVVMNHGGGPLGLSIQWDGTEGSVAVSRGQKLATTIDGLLTTKFGPGDTRLYESTSHRGNFLDCVKSRRKTICTAEIGRRTVTVCHIGNICYRLKRSLKWDPEDDRFVGDEEANRMLRRPMRAPWTV